ASDFFQGLTDVGQTSDSSYTSILQCSEFFVSRAFTTRDDGTSMAHAFACWRSHTSNIGNNWFADIVLDKCRCFFFRAAADLTDHDNRFSFGICFEQLQDINEVGTWDRIITNTYAGGLTKAGISCLFDRFVSQSS